MKKTIKQITLTAIFSFCAVLFLTAAANAAVFTVTTIADTGAGSLRQAITDSKSSPGDDTIDFAIPTADCPGGVCTITLGSTLPSITTSGGALTIDNTAGTNKIAVSGNNAFRVLTVSSSVSLTLTGIAIINGNRAGGGGGISNSGTLTLNNSIISGNTAGSSGGGIESIGTLILNNSTVSGNTAGSGGGISSSGSLTLNDSTVSGNISTGTTLSGGGISSSSGQLTLNNSTVSGNTAANGSGGIYGILISLDNSTVSGNTGLYSGGIYVEFILTMNNSTVAFNASTYDSPNCYIQCAGGVQAYDGLNTINNSIIAKNTVAHSGAAPDLLVNYVNEGSFNLIGIETGTTGAGITNGTNGNQIGTSAAPIDPLLAELADNGGQTKTHALQGGSPAIDTGNSTAATDQRGFTSPFDNLLVTDATGGNGADIGAFELQFAPTAAAVTISGRLITPEGRGLMNATVVLTDVSGASHRVRTSAFGYFRFKDIAAGQTVILSVISKRYQFAPQVYTASEDLTGIIMQAQTDDVKRKALPALQSSLKH